MDSKADSSASTSAFHAGLIPSLLLRNLVVAQTQQVWSCREGVEEINHDRAKRTPEFAKKTFVRFLIFFACCFFSQAALSSQLGRLASRLRIAHKFNMWIERENNPAQWGWLAARKLAATGENIS